MTLSLRSPLVLWTLLIAFLIVFNTVMNIQAAGRWTMEARSGYVWSGH